MCKYLAHCGTLCANGQICNPESCCARYEAAEFLGVHHVPAWLTPINYEMAAKLKKEKAA